MGVNSVENRGDRSNRAGGSAAGRLTTCLLLAALIGVLPVTTTAAGTAAVENLERRFGRPARDRGERLLELVAQLRQAPLGRQLTAVNHFFNAFPYRADRLAWGRDDHWATPVEFIGNNGGDCEDFAIGKYHALRALGVADERLLVVYVFDRVRHVPHVVLLHHDPVSPAPALVLDNRSTIRSLAARDDLVPIYGVNGAGVHVPTPGAGRLGKLQMADASSAEWRRLEARMAAAGALLAY